MKKIAIIILIMMVSMCAFSQSSTTPDTKNWKHTGLNNFTKPVKIETKDLTGVLVQYLTTLYAKQGDTTQAKGTLVFISDTLYRKPGHVVTQTQWKNKPTKGNFLNIWRELGGNVLATPVAWEIGPPSATFPMTTGTLYWCLVEVVDTIPTLTGFQWTLSTQGNYTAGTFNGIGWYSLSGTTVTLVQGTTNSGTLWTTASGVAASVNLPTPITNVVPGFYYIAALYTYVTTQTTAPSINTSLIGSVINAVTLTNAVKIAGYTSGQTTLPASAATSTIIATSNALGITVK